MAYVAINQEYLRHHTRHTNYDCVSKQCCSQPEKVSVSSIHAALLFFAMTNQSTETLFDVQLQPGRPEMLQCASPSPHNNQPPEEKENEGMLSGIPVAAWWMGGGGFLDHYGCACKLNKAKQSAGRGM